MLKGLLIQFLQLFKISLFLRIVIDYIRMFARTWRPNAILITFFELIYTVTEKPMAFVRRFIPPLRIGGVSLDLSFIVLLVAVNMAIRAIDIAL